MSKRVSIIGEHDPDLMARLLKRKLARDSPRTLAEGEQEQALTDIKDPELRRRLQLPTIH